MNGAESMLQTLLNAGVEVCFANPGTSEMHGLRYGKDQSMRSVLGHAGGVCSGAADGYARIAGKPAALLHLGPGLSMLLRTYITPRKRFACDQFDQGSCDLS